MPAMADHTIVNLKSVDNAAAQQGMAPEEFQARFARSTLELEKSGLSLFEVGPDFQVPWGHRHEEQEEIYLVLRGSAVVVVDGERLELGEWDAIRVAPSAARSFQGGPDGAQVLAYGAGPKGDSEMIDDFW